MKKVLLASSVIALGLVAPAMADTVNIKTEAAFSSPQSAQSSTIGFPFVGTNTITFQVAGKTCTWIGSNSARGPAGCNYSITVNPAGALVNPFSGGNQGCTPTDQMVQNCH